ncbi:MAG: MFS transporter [bacterium]
MEYKNVITSQLLLNWITRILFFTTLSALLPAMPNYISDLGGNKAQTGIVIAAMALGVLLFRPIVGKKIDVVGRKIVLIFGILIFIIAPIIYIFIKSVIALLLARVFHGLGLAAFGTASITLITDSAPYDKRTQVISYTGMMNTIGFAVGPVLGFTIWNTWGYNVLFGFISVLSALCLLTAAFIKETKIPSHSQNEVNYWHAIKHRKILVAAAIILLVAMVHSGIIIFLPLFLSDVDFNFGIFFTVYGISAFIVRLAVGPASERFGRGPSLVFALFLIAIGVLTLSQTKGMYFIFFAAVLYGFGFGAHQPTLTTLVADNTTEETRGKIFSFYYGGFDLGFVIAGPLLGVIAENFELKSVFFVSACLASVALIIFATLMESTLLRSLRCALTLKKTTKQCMICDQYQEVAPQQAEEYFKNS